MIPRWLTLKQAVNYCPYSKSRLIQLVNDGMINGGQQTDKKTQSWFFDRLSIDDYMQSMCNPDSETVKKKAIEIIRKVR